MSENSTNTNSVPEPAPRRRNWRLLLEIALGLAVIALGALLLFRPGEAAPAPTETPEPTPEPVATPEPTPQPLTLCLHGPEEDSLVLLCPGDFYRAPEAPLEGYTFLRWQNADGEAFPAAGAQVWEETDLYPVYAMRLGRADHAPYLSLDEQGAFHPGNPLSRREVVSALYFLLDTELVGDGSFLDLPEDDPLAPAAATLKQLGVLSGSRLHPDETITRQEFLAMLCCFFPEGTEPAEFSDLTEQDALYPLFRTAAERGWIESGPDTPARPDDELSRLEFVSILSEAMDRHGDREKRRELVGTILDLRHDDPHFWDVAEAVIPHKASGEGAEERWIRSKALPLREEGLFFLGTELHAIDSEGNPVVNGKYAGLLFDKNGVETSGSCCPSWWIPRPWRASRCCGSSSTISMRPSATARETCIPWAKPAGRSGTLSSFWSSARATAITSPRSTASWPGPWVTTPGPSPARSSAPASPLWPSIRTATAIP